MLLVNGDTGIFAHLSNKLQLPRKIGALGTAQDAMAESSAAYQNQSERMPRMRFMS